MRTSDFVEPLSTLRRSGGSLRVTLSAGPVDLSELTRWFDEGWFSLSDVDQANVARICEARCVEEPGFTFTLLNISSGRFKGCAFVKGMRRIAMKVEHSQSIH